MCSASLLFNTFCSYLYVYNFKQFTDRKISELLAYLERPDLHPFERAEALNSLRGIIAAIWGSDEIR